MARHAVSGSDGTQRLVEYAGAGQQLLFLSFGGSQLPAGRGARFSGTRTVGRHAETARIVGQCGQRYRPLSADGHLQQQRFPGRLSSFERDPELQHQTREHRELGDRHRSPSLRRTHRTRRGVLRFDDDRPDHHRSRRLGHGCGIETHQCGRGQQPRCGGGARSASRRDEELALGHRSQLVEELERAGGVGAGRGDVAAQFEADGRFDGLHLRLSGRCAGTPLRNRLRDGARGKFLRRRGREVRGLLRSQDHRCRNRESRADGDAQRSGQHLSQLQGGSEHAAQLQGTVAGDDFHGATGRTGLFGDERRALDAGQTRKFPAGSLRRSDRRRGQSPCRRNLFEEPYGDPECRRILQPLCAVPQQH